MFTLLFASDIGLVCHNQLNIVRSYLVKIFNINANKTKARNGEFMENDMSSMAGSLAKVSVVVLTDGQSRGKI